MAELGLDTGVMVSEPVTNACWRPPNRDRLWRPCWCGSVRYPLRAGLPGAPRGVWGPLESLQVAAPGRQQSAKLS
jgi:hypothetical protein